jgi:hypothetical protein
MDTAKFGEVRMLGFPALDGRNCCLSCTALHCTAGCLPAVPPGMLDQCSALLVSLMNE